MSTETGALTPYLLGANLLTQLASGTIGARGARAEGDAARAAADRNAVHLNLQADDAVRRGQAAAVSMHARERLLRGAQRVAADGINPDTGSASDLQLEAREMSERDKRIILNNAALDAFGFRSAAVNERAQGRVAQIGARSRANMTLLSAGVGAVRSAAAYSYMTRGDGVPEPTGGGLVVPRYSSIAQANTDVADMGEDRFYQ